MKKIMLYVFFLCMPTMSCYAMDDSVEIEFPDELAELGKIIHEREVSVDDCMKFLGNVSFGKKEAWLRERFENMGNDGRIGYVDQGTTRSRHRRKDSTAMVVDALLNLCEVIEDQGKEASKIAKERLDLEQAARTRKEIVARRATIVAVFNGIGAIIAFVAGGGATEAYDYFTS